MKREFRLTRSTDFKRVRRLGKSYAHPLIVLIALPNEQGESTRLGVVAGRTVGNAVKRNRAKRLLRAGIQPYLHELPVGWDILLIARRSLVESSFQAAQQALLNLLRRARLVKNIDDV
ncbi:MAG: ribonuclease P protein component [Omnitrophica WOR_2 bacterium]